MKKIINKRLCTVHSNKNRKFQIEDAQTFGCEGQIYECGGQISQPSFNHNHLWVFLRSFPPLEKSTQ